MAYTGNSIVDYLGSTGQASDFASRQKLATSKGITGYTGTAAQNTQLLGLLRTPTPTNTTGVSSAYSTNGMSVAKPTPTLPNPFNNPVSKLMTPATPTLNLNPNLNSGMNFGTGTSGTTTPTNTPKISTPTTPAPVSKAGSAPVVQKSAQISQPDPNEIMNFPLPETGSSFKGTKAQYDAYVASHYPTEQPKPTVDVKVEDKGPATSSALASGATPEDIAAAAETPSKSDDISEQLKTIRDDYANLTKSYNTANTEIGNQAIPMGFITGQQEYLRQRYQNEKSDLGLREQNLVSELAVREKLDSKQQKAMEMILTSFKGLDFNTLDAKTQAQLSSLAASIGIPAGVLKEGLKLNVPATKSTVSESDLLSLAKSYIDNGQYDNMDSALAAARRYYGTGVSGLPVTDTSTSGVTTQQYAPNSGIVATPSGKAYDIGSYATDPTHEAKVQSIVNTIGTISTAEQAGRYINSVAPNSPVTGSMVMASAQKYGVAPEMIMAIMQQDSSFGTAGKAVRTFNPGNVGNTDSGATVNMGSWQNGVDAVAKNLAGRVALSNDQAINNKSSSKMPNDYLFPMTQQQLAELFPEKAPSMRDTAYLVANYKADLGKVTSFRGTQRELITSMASQINPSFDMTQYQARQKVLNSYTSGKDFRNIISLNTAIKHLETLKKAADGLDNKGWTAYNTVGNWIKKEFGDPSVQVFNSALNGVAGEMSSIFKSGTSGTDQEIKSWKESITSSSSPSQIAGAINTMLDLMDGRITTLNDSFTDMMGAEPRFPILSSNSKRVLSTFGITDQTLPNTGVVGRWQSTNQ